MTNTGREGHGATKNTDRELWREREGDYYADSLHVTEGGGIGMNVGGYVIVKPIKEWHRIVNAYLANEGAPSTPSPMRDDEIESAIKILNAHDMYEEAETLERRASRAVVKALKHSPAPVAVPEVWREEPGLSYLYFTSQRKAWHHNLDDSWKEEAFERFRYVECGIFSKPTASLTADDRQMVRDYGKPDEDFITPTHYMPLPAPPGSGSVAGETKS